jgi:hypothetical protein
MSGVLNLWKLHCQDADQEVIWGGLWIEDAYLSLRRGDLYVLTELGQQFVHYAMTDLPPRISYQYPDHLLRKC